MFRPGLAAASLCFFPRPCSVIVRCFLSFSRGRGRGEEEEEGEGCCTWAGEDSLGPGFPSLWDLLFLAILCDR